jgi:hypothetical protein
MASSGKITHATKIGKILFLGMLSIMAIQSFGQWSQTEFVIGTFWDPRLTCTTDTNPATNGAAISADIARFAEAKEAGFNLMTGTGENVDVIWHITAGMDYALYIASKAGVKYMPTDLTYWNVPAYDEATASSLMTHYKSLPNHMRNALYGYHIKDEPIPADEVNLKAWLSSIKAKDNTKLAYFNMMPRYYYPAGAGGDASYNTYLETFVNDADPAERPDVLAFDNYPILAGPTYRTDYFYNLDIVRTKAGTRPFWGYPMTTQCGGYASPTAASIMFSDFCPLAYGAKGLIYFTYVIPTSGGPWANGLIDASNNQTPIYSIVKPINQYIKNLVGPTIMNSNNLNAWHKSTSPTGETTVTLLSGSTPLLASTSGLNDNNLLAGIFQDKVNSSIYHGFIVNKSITASVSTVTVVLQGDYTDKVFLAPSVIGYTGSKTFTAVNTTYNGSQTTFSIPGGLAAGEGRLFTAMPFSTSVTNVSCGGGSDGSIAVTMAAVGGGTLIYSIDNGSTYQASNTFSNLAVGNYTIMVRAMDARGNQFDYISNPVIISTGVPEQSSAITGTTTPLQGSSQNYSVTNVAGVVYNWIFPAGWVQTGGGTTNSVTVTTSATSGTIQITPSNACGNGTARTLSVTPTATGTDRYSRVASGNWNATSTWSDTPTGATGKSVPAAGNNVYIQSGNNITVNVASACASVNISSGTLTIGSGFALTVNGDVNGAGTIATSTTGTRTINLKGNWNFNGSFTGSRLWLTINGTADQVIFPSSNLTCNTFTLNKASGTLFISKFPTITTTTLTAGGINYCGGDQSTLTPAHPGNVTFSGSGTKTMSASISSITGNLTINGTVTVTAAANINISGTLNVGYGGILNMGTNTLVVSNVNSLGIIRTQNTSAVPITTAKTWSGTVKYDAAGGQTVSSGTYLNLTLAGSGAKTVTGSTINGILSLEGAATASGTSPNFSVTSTLQYKGTACQTTGIELPTAPTKFFGSGGVIINNSNGVILGNSADIANGLVLTSGALTINSGINLTVEGNTTLGSAQCLVIKTEGSFIDNGITINGTGSARVEKTLTDRRWWYISSPLSSSVTASSAFGPLSGISGSGRRFAYYDEANHAYTYLASDYVLNTPLRGYLYKDNNASELTTATFTGSLNTGLIGGDDNLSRQTSGSFQGFNLICNPYPSAINLGDNLNPADNTPGLTMTNIQPTFWFYNNGSYKTYNWTTGIGIGTSRYVPAMQSFWVRVVDGYTSGTFSIDNRARCHNSQAFYKTEAETNVFRIQVKNDSLTDEAVVAFFADASNDYDSFDSEKMFSDDNYYPQIYTVTVDNTIVAINGQPEIAEGKDCIVPLGFKTNREGTFTLQAINMAEFNPNISVYLEDTQLNYFQELNLSDTYTFSSEAIDNTDRFKLHFGNMTATEISDDENAVNVYSYAFENTLYVYTPADGCTIELYDMLGNLIISKQTVNGLNAFTVNVSKGVYIIKIQNGSKIVSDKIMI